MKTTNTIKIKEDKEVINNFVCTLNQNWIKIKIINSEFHSDMAMQCTLNESNLGEYLMSTYKSMYGYLTPKLLNEMVEELKEELFYNHLKINQNSYNDNKIYETDLSIQRSKNLMEHKLLGFENEMLQFITCTNDRFSVNEKELEKFLTKKHTIETCNSRQEKAYELINGIAQNTKELLKLYSDTNDPYYTNRYYLLKIISNYMDENNNLSPIALNMVLNVK